MASPTASVIDISVGSSNVSHDVIYAETNFSVSASAQPGTATVTIRDPNRVYSFTEGSLVELKVNSQRAWRGYAMEVDMGYLFEADPDDRKWVLSCVDLNILLDKLILYNHVNPAKYPDGGGTYKRRKVTVDGVSMGYQVSVPPYTYDGDYIRAMLNDFDIDLVNPSLKKGKIESVAYVNVDGKHWTPPSAGITLRDFLTDVSRNINRSQPGSTVWYIDPDAYLVYTAQDHYSAPFWVGDEDPSHYIDGVQGENVRDLRITSSIDSIKDDVFVFASELDPRPDSKQKQLKYSRKQNTSAISGYGLFQHSETLSGSFTQQRLDARANRIIAQEGEPGKTAEFTTFRSGLYPGQIIWVSSQAHGILENFPIRNVSYSFPTPSIVQYRVSCSYDTQDPWGLLLALRRPPRRGLKQPRFAIIDLRRNPEQTLPAARAYTLVKEYPRSLGSRYYQCSYGYIRNSLVVWVGKLRQFSVGDPDTASVGFIESAPGDGRFRLAEDPTGGKNVYVEYHVSHELEG